MKIIFKCLVFVWISFAGCKSDFLDAKPSTDLLVPKTLDDYRKLLNYNSLYVSPALGHFSADEYVYLNEANWTARAAPERNSYIWNREIFEGQLEIPDWNRPYQNIFYANNVIDGLAKLNRGPDAQHDQLNGWAHFIRAYAYFDLAAIFAKAYNPATATEDLGLPLKLTGRIDELRQRASVQQTYNQIIDDLDKAVALLPTAFQQSNRMSPSKATAHAMLARVYLAMNNYSKAEFHANSSLALYDKLIDYNTVSTTAASPFAILNDEVLYSGQMVGGYTANINGVSNTFVTIDPSIINAYHANDLRLTIFFGRTTTGNYYLKRGYFGSGNFAFTGLATDEVYLIEAECMARRSEVDGAMQLLNRLLRNRFKNGISFIPVTASSREEAISVILMERRKELVWRGQRWMDIKRLNVAGANIVLRRNIGGREYVLQPNSNLYALPIPDDEITRSKIIQNPR